MTIVSVSPGRMPMCSMSLLFGLLKEKKNFQHRSTMQKTGKEHDVLFSALPFFELSFFTRFAPPSKYQV